MLGDNNPQLVVIDCRFSLADTSQGENHFANSRIPGSQYAHLDRDLSSAIIKGETGRHPLPDADELAARFASWGISNQTQIVAYDDKVSAIAGRFWWLSRWLGHDACAVLDGGFAAWQAANFIVETGTATKPNAADFKRQSSLTGYIEKENVLNKQHYLLDAREAERYAGKHEPIDPVAGHIPGAHNAPFLSNVNADGTFKSASELQKRFDPIIAAAKDNTVVHYCGSGVTAAHNMLAMMIAEREPGLMYAGSFSEWVSQNGEQFPVARLDD